MVTEFHFLRPLWFLALVPLVLALWHLGRRRRDSRQWGAVCDARLLPYILVRRTARRGHWSLVAFAGAGVLAITALAGPAWERVPTPVFRTDSYLVIALDLSRSMEAADLKPSRLARARFKIEDILTRRREGQTALIVFSGDTFTVTPLTDDTETIRHQLAVLSPSMMPSTGSNGVAALNHAARLLKQAGAPRGRVLLISDGVDGGGVETARALRAESYRLSVLGVGSAGGAPVPLASGGFLKDEAGNIVIPKLVAAPLRTLASAGGGRYHGLTSDGTDIDHLLADDEPVRASGDGRSLDLTIERWVEEGPWLLLPLLPVAALAFRRGLLWGLVFVLLPLPDTAFAFEWRDLWWTHDQQANQAFKQKNFGDAAERFRNPEWKASAHYKAGDYEKALETLKGIDTADGFYNRGNALAKLGRLPEALAAYDRALKLDAGNADARYNKELVEKLLQQNRQQNSGGDSGSGDQAPGTNDDTGKGRSDGPQPDAKERSTQGQGEGPNPEASDGDQGAPEAGRNTRRAEPEQPEEGAGTDPSGRSDEDDSAQSEVEARTGSESEEPTATTEARGESAPDGESKQATEQWLRRIPDDPGGLLRRKFEYQYKRRNQHQESGTATW